MAQVQILKVKTTRRTQLVDVTDRIAEMVAKSEVRDGTCFVYVPHTTAAVMINEHADPDVAHDLEGAFDRLVPDSEHFRHAEANSDSHMKAVMVGASQIIFIANGALVLGRWQGIFFCEFDGSRERSLRIKSSLIHLKPANLRPLGLLGVVLQMH